MAPYQRDRRMLKRKKKEEKASREKNPGGFRASLRRLWRWTKIFLVLCVIGWLALAYHFRSVDREIESKFDRPRKWDLPSRVYSDAQYIYPGSDIGIKEIVAKLDRLGYRSRTDKIMGSGDYVVLPNRLEIWLHDFAYPDEPFKGFPIRLDLDGTVILGMVRSDTQEPVDVVKLEPEEVSSIYNDQMEDRTIVTLKDVPETLVSAIILIEDERFLKHHGVDPWGILRAMVVNLKAMHVVQGGSTLTQQLVKNYFLYPQRSFMRKLNEMFIAWRIEKYHTKAEILEAYLNEIYLGQRGATSVSGVEEASRLYFGKGVRELTIGECALLAGMIRSPSLYNPIKHPDTAKERRDFVLGRLLEKGVITKDQYVAARVEKIVTPNTKARVATAPYFIDFVKRQLTEFYPADVLKTEGLRIFTTLDMAMQLAGERAVGEELARVEKDNASVLPKEHAGPLESCLVAVQPSTGYLRALVGGRDYGISQFDHCTQAQRQPGSTFKPFVYLTALDPRRSKQSFTPASIEDDSPFEVESGNQKWSPKNYEGKTKGPVTLRTALEESLNIPTARLAIDAGLSNVITTARDAGITSKLEEVPSMALGSFEVSPMEMAGAYTIFPNGGIRAEPISIINVVTKDGEVLQKKSIQMKRAFDAAPVFLTTNILKGVVDRGTGAGVRARGYLPPAAGKTGTTSNYRDAWFVGFTPGLLALVWVGYDDNAEMKLSGARAALPLWVRFMKDADSKGDGDFASPPGVILVKIDPITGGLSDASCPDGVYEAFIEGTDPNQSCDQIRSTLPTAKPSSEPSQVVF